VTIHQHDILIMQISLISLTVSVLLAVVVIIAGTLANRIYKGRDIPNPFAPFIRMAERRQVYRHRMKLIRRGMDPDYLAHLEKQNAAAIR
jgi:hypothetical protein